MNMKDRNAFFDIYRTLLLLAIAICFPSFASGTASALNNNSTSSDACEISAVGLIGEWVDAGATEEPFPFQAIDGRECNGDFNNDVLPLFTEESIWFEGSQSCIECHFDNSEDSRHEMDLSSYTGIMTGGDVLSKPPGVAIINPGDWNASKLRGRLRDNRMPPGWEFDIEEGNRDGPHLQKEGGAIYAVELIGAWTDAGAPNGAFSWKDAEGAEHSADFETEILPLFTQENIWFEGSQSCVECHFDNSEDSRHEMDLSSYAGIMTGGDVLSKPPGVSIIEAGNWHASKLRARLRDNRMSPGWEFDIEEGNRDGPVVSAGQSGEVAKPVFSTGECEIYAVDLIGAWVDSGAKEGLFIFPNAGDTQCEGDFVADVLPLFTQENVWFKSSQSCVECHFDNSEDSRHEMDLSSYAGIMTGGDVLSKPPGVAIVTPGDWNASKLRSRLRNNRMPPDWEFDIEEGNRDGPLMQKEGSTIYAVDLIGAWVDAGVPEGAFSWNDAQGNVHEASFDMDVLPLFTQDNIWFEGSQACTECHFDNSEDSRHEMDLSSYAGIMTGGDVLSKPPGVAIVAPGDWHASKLRGRLRDNRMPPGWEFDIEEGNRDGPIIKAGKKLPTQSDPMAVMFESGECTITTVDAIGQWVDSGASQEPFTLTALDGRVCNAEFNTDILPLFTQENVWFKGSQSCTECHFDNSEDSRHEMDLSSYAGIMTGGDVLSKPPGVAIVTPSDWNASKLRSRLRNNRMPPDWEFDIEEGNRDGPLLQKEGGTIYAVDLIGAWTDAGAPEGAFSWNDAQGKAHEASFDADVLPLFTEENIWFEGSQSCVECHFDNSEDSRHEMDLSSYAGIMTGGDVLSKPPGVAIVAPGDWHASKLRGRLRDNRMPPGWEFDIEEGNRDGALIRIGSIVATTESVAAVNENAAAGEETATNTNTSIQQVASSLPEPTETRSVSNPTYNSNVWSFLGLVTLIAGAIVAGISLALRKPSESNGKQTLLMLLGILIAALGAFALYLANSGGFTKTVTVSREVPYAVSSTPVDVAAALAEIRVEEWNAQLPANYSNLKNPFADNADAITSGEKVFEKQDCYECHGKSLDGNGKFSKGLLPKPVDLTDPNLMGLSFMTDTYLFWRIKEGGAAPPFYSGMPAWGGALKDDQIWQLVSYIRSKVGGSSDDKSQVIVALAEKGGCFACHRIESIGRGGKIGPSWEEIGKMAGSRIDGMSAEDYIRTSISDPSAFAAEKYQAKLGMMPTNIAELLSTEEIDIVVQYLLDIASSSD